MKSCLNCRYSYTDELNQNLCCSRRKGDLCPRIVQTFFENGKKIDSEMYSGCWKWAADELPEYKEGEAVIYQNGNHFELGIVKRVCGNDKYFINYHTGDTAAMTHAEHLHKITNRYAFHVIRLDPDDNERR